MLPSARAVKASPGDRVADTGKVSFNFRLAACYTSDDHISPVRGEMTALEDVEAAWKLCEAAREYSSQQGRDVPPQEILEKINLASPLVDIERTKREAKNSTPTKVFLKSAYGVEYRESTRKWIPFRHGEIDPKELKIST